jgi:hypothetical protein
MVASAQSSIHGRVTRLAHAQAQGQAQTVGSITASRFVPSTTSIALPTNQGPQGPNLALVPTGTLTPHEIRRELFVAVFQGPYTVGPGRTSTEALQTYIRGAGFANTMRHADIQLRIITPKDPKAQIAGVSAIFDRNLNSNTVLGFDVSSPPTNVDRGGRPNFFPQASIDVNESAGVYDEAFAQGTFKIRYIPSSRHTPGVISQGKAIIAIRAQIYTTQVDFLLRNTDINP